MSNLPTLKTTNFESKLDVNNYVCVTLRSMGLPTNHGPRLEVLKELGKVNNCPIVRELITYYKLVVS